MASGPPYYVYVLSNVHRTVLYVGMTSDLQTASGGAYECLYGTIQRDGACIL
jgi:hypothetical protein